MNTTQSAAVDRSSIHWFKVRKHHIRMTAIMVLADISGFLLAGSILYIANRIGHFFALQPQDARYGIIVPVCLLLYALSKLYPSIGINPAEEIKLVSINTSISFLISVFIFGLVEMRWRPNYLALIPLGFLSILAILCARWGLRILSVQLGLWGIPVVVIGPMQGANQLANYFLDRRRLGFIPTHIITRTNNAFTDTAISVPVIPINELFTFHLDKIKNEQIHTALIDISEYSNILDKDIIKQLFVLFPNFILISSMTWMEGASLQVHDFEGLMGVDVQKNLLNPLEVFVKRFMDIALSILIGILTIPLWLPAIILIPLDSSGPVLYNQKRVGQDRRKRERPGNHKRKVVVYKFRTMFVNADQALAEHLAANKEARQEWEHHQKLRNDPRITRIGKWLRKFSIDELPQIINVLKGEMSLVGPRPIMLEQIPDYGDRINIYHSFKPGLTGLWQVSGRNHTSFQERTILDQYYIHNWSVWLDIYILLRTVWVVISQEGAY